MANLILWSVVQNERSPIRTVACYQLASWLRQHGFSVKVIEFCHLLSTDDLVAITEKHIDSSTLAIGVSSTFWQKTSEIPNPSEPEWVRKAREKLSKHDVKWLLGGAKSDAPFCSLEWIKFHGYAEDELLKWMRENAKRVRLPDLAFDIYHSHKSFMPDDFIQPDEVLPIELGRGCMFKCRFCSFPLIGKKAGTYSRNPQLIKEEFIRNYEEWGTTKYYFQDDTVNESMEKVTMLANIAQSLPFQLEWVGYNRIDLIGTQPGMSQALKDSGLASTFFGIESFNQTAAKAVGKGWNGKHAKDQLLKLRAEWGEDITWCLGFIVGLPGETVDDLYQTAQWCIDNSMHEWLFNGLYISGRDKIWKSEFEKNAADYGYTFLSKDTWVNGSWTSIRARQIAEALNRFSYPHITLGCFTAAALSSLGKELRTITNTKYVEFDWEDAKRKTQEHAQRYATLSLT